LIWLYVPTWSPALDFFAAQMRIIGRIGDPKAKEVACDVIVAAMRSPGGASAAILREARQDRVTLLVSVPLAIEYEATCLEPEESGGATEQGRQDKHKSVRRHSGG